MATFREIKDDLISRFSGDEILELMYQAGWKEPKKMYVDRKGRCTIRCSKHLDEETSAKGKKQKRASCVVNLNTSFFECQSCHDKGSLLDVAMYKEGTQSPMAGLKYLADLKGYNINLSPQDQKLKPIQKQEREKEVISYFTFDPNRAFKSYSTEELVAGYSSFSDLMKYKAVMTVLIRHSLEVDQSKKIDFLCGERKITPTNPRLKRVGFLPTLKNDMEFWKRFETYFPITDLIEFGLYRPADHKYSPMTWKYSSEELIVFPNQDIYSDLYHGCQLRALVTPDWWPGKEMQMTNSKLIHPIPFCLSREVLLSKEPLVITEGSIDGLSTDIDFSANPGITVYHKPYLGLYRNKKIFVAYDMDRPGQGATFGYESVYVYRGKVEGKKAQRNINFPLTDKGKKEASKFKRRLERWFKKPFSVTLHQGLLQDLVEAGVADPAALVWDAKFGKDHNELRQGGNHRKEVFTIKRLK